VSSPLAVRELGLPSPTKAGLAPVLLLLHGNGDSSACWPDAARRWGESYRVVAVDARGHGDSPPFAREQLTEPGDVFVADAVELCEQLAKEGQPLLGVGHSLGAGTLTGVVAQRPDLLRAAVLIDPPWDVPPVLGPRPTVGKARVELVLAYQRDPDKALAVHRREHPQWPDDEHFGWVEAKQSLDLGFIATGAGRPSTPWQDLVRAIRTPTLVVAGDQGCLVGEATRAELAAIANASVEVAVIPGADHYVRQSAPESFHAVVDPWLAAQRDLT
jgi:pimeloyl-ACP methyl ester carboxylesterase